MRILTPLLVSPPFDLQFGSNIDGFVPPMFRLERRTSGSIQRGGKQHIHRETLNYAERNGQAEISRNGTFRIERD